METKYDPQTVIDLIEKHKGNLSAVAKSLKCSRRTLQTYAKDNPDIESALHDARESITDLAESKLVSALNKGEAWAVCFYLKTQGKGRGYVERHEHMGADNQPIPVLITGMNTNDL